MVLFFSFTVLGLWVFKINIFFSFSTYVFSLYCLIITQFRYFIIHMKWELKTEGTQMCWSQELGENLPNMVQCLTSGVQWLGHFFEKTYCIKAKQPWMQNWIRRHMLDRLVSFFEPFCAILALKFENRASMSPTFFW